MGHAWLDSWELGERMQCQPGAFALHGHGSACLVLPTALPAAASALLGIKLKADWLLMLTGLHPCPAEWGVAACSASQLPRLCLQCWPPNLSLSPPCLRWLPHPCATDADAIYDPAGWPKERRPIASPVRCSELQGLSFASGSMAPKVAAACRFVTAGGGRAAVGNISDALAVLQGRAGTTIVAG